MFFTALFTAVKTGNNEMWSIYTMGFYLPVNESEFQMQMDEAGNNYSEWGFRDPERQILKVSPYMWMLPLNLQICVFDLNSSNQRRQKTSKGPWMTYLKEKEIEHKW